MGLACQSSRSAAEPPVLIGRQYWASMHVTTAPRNRRRGVYACMNRQPQVGGLVRPTGRHQDPGQPANRSAIGPRVDQWRPGRSPRCRATSCADSKPCRSPRCMGRLPIRRSATAGTQPTVWHQPQAVGWRTVPQCVALASRAGGAVAARRTWCGGYGRGPMVRNGDFRWLVQGGRVWLAPS